MGFANMTPEQVEQGRVEAERVAVMRNDVDALFIEFGPKCMPDREKQIKRRLTEMPVSQRIRYLKATRGRSMAAGVKAHCLECCGDDRLTVAECTDLACALYPYRPGATK